MERSRLIDLTMPFASEDKSRSWFYFLSTLALVVAAVSATILLEGIPRVVSSFLMALFMVRMFVIYHDFRHEAILRHSRVAQVFMTLFGIIALAPASIWSETHDHHHHNNSKFSTFVVGSFPVVSTTVFRSLTRAGRIKYLVIRNPLMIGFAYIPIFLVSFCLWPFFENPKRYWDCGLAALAHGMLAVLLFYSGGWPMLTFTLLLPSVIMYAIGGYLFYAQHNFPSVKLKAPESWDYFDAALHSSSHIRMSRFMNWVTANIGYHHIHHVNSRIPFYRLPEVMTSVPELQQPLTTSLGPVEIVRCLRLKLWDEEKQRLVSLREFRQVKSV
jgi:omega-6 fatty acid desaturase (delta-12 desaturase)